MQEQRAKASLSKRLQAYTAHIPRLLGRLKSELEKRLLIQQQVRPGFQRRIFGLKPCQKNGNGVGPHLFYRVVRFLHGCHVEIRVIIRLKIMYPMRELFALIRGFFGEKEIDDGDCREEGGNDKDDDAAAVQLFK